QGESTPKARPKGVVDGKRVNIPVLLVTAMGGRRRLGQHGVGCPCSRWKAEISGKSGISRPRTDNDPSFEGEVVDAMLPGKASKLQVTRNRTPNRHRWSGREYQGA